ncbi:hypothetical protein ACSVCE_18750 [Chromobacterium haemolyticum]|uniref:hypothetical protein n=1 Tax=Chromobacterium haemolyticum TaxID=394935 RepID=UPI0040554509
MPIDNCQHTFASLAANVLPSYMAMLQATINTPIELARFAQPGVAEKTLTKQLGLSSDFSGCYVLIEQGRPFYVGISRGVIKRLRQHVTDKTHFGASLAYKMASQTVGHQLTRDEAMKDPQIALAFAQAQQRLIAADVAFIRIDNPLELYLFEAYSAMQLDTADWNTFRTH